MTYNQNRHIELLKRYQDFQNQGKNLFFENKDEALELFQYNVAIQRHIFWQDRSKVALFMEDFVNQKIYGELLCDYLYGLRRQLINNCEKFKLELISNSEKMEDFQPDPRSKKLNGLLTALFCECDNFGEDYQNEEFYTFIKNAFLKLQEVLNEE